LANALRRSVESAVGSGQFVAASGDIGVISAIGQELLPEALYRPGASGYRQNGNKAGGTMRTDSSVAEGAAGPA
jgi:hypothetical protein